MPHKCQCTCSMCGKVIRSRASKNHTGQENLFRAVTKHQRKNHRAALNRRIKAGIARAKEAELTFDVPEFKDNLSKNPREVFRDLLAKSGKPRKKNIELIDRWVAPFLGPTEKVAWDIIKDVFEGPQVFVRRAPGG